MVKSEKKTKDPLWLKLRGYRVVALKPDFEEHTIELERAMQEGIAVYPDLARAGCDRGRFSNAIPRLRTSIRSEGSPTQAGWGRGLRAAVNARGDGKGERQSCRATVTH